RLNQIESFKLPQPLCQSSAQWDEHFATRLDDEATARIDPDSDGVVAQAVAPLIHRRQGTAYPRHRRPRHASIGLLLPEPIDQSERQEVGEGPSLDTCGRNARCPDSGSGPI